MNNTQECVQRITKAVDQLRNLVHACSTSSVVGWCFTFNIIRGNYPEQNPQFNSRLVSPAKQCSFLIGILLESQEPDAPKDFGEEDWERAQDLLNEAFEAYLPLYFPSREEAGSLTNEWYKVREVAMLAFLHFYNTGLVASHEQVATRIRRYLTPFDDDLSRTLSINATQALEICEWVSDRLQRGLDDLSAVFKEEKLARLALLDHAKAQNWSLEELRRETNTGDYRTTFEKWMTAQRKLGKLEFSELEAAFPGVGEQFWKLFTIGRGKGAVLKYPTERSLADERPLILVSDTEAICPLANNLFNAVLLQSEQVLSSGDRRASYFRARDKIVEGEVADHFRRIVGSQAIFHAKIFETPDLHHEHDLVILDKKLCLIVEAKASPPIEPFRDPEKAFVRLRHAFRADTGIQKAYEQGMRLLGKLRKGEWVTLYNEKGRVVAQISPELADRTFCVCVTRDNYGPVATNLALLLEKEDQEPYPWAINILDLEMLGEAWDYFGWGTNELLEYLRHRIQAHGKVFSDDELVYAGYYVKHGSLEQALKEPADLLQLDSNYSSVFDDIYRYLHQAGPPVELKRKPPVLIDVRKSLLTGKPVFVDGPGKKTTPKVVRNKPCPCGSGKKYKKCCGR